MASLAALSEWPDLIKSVIFVEKINKWGVYAARICWKGVWIEVIIDNFFPVKDHPPEPCFSHSTFDETWVLVLEKTWAKLHGNYCKIDGGLAREPLHDLTGAPAKTYKPDVGKAVDTEKNLFIWRRIKHGEKKNVKINKYLSSMPCVQVLFFTTKIQKKPMRWRMIKALLQVTYTH